MSQITLVKPTAADGPYLQQLVAASPPLDGNSLYCNLLHCSYFANTSIAAKQDGELVGFISAFASPLCSKTLFVWQVVVAEQVRGQGLALRMLTGLLNRADCQQFSYLDTTINPGNQGSWRLFERLQQQLGCAAQRTTLFNREQHFLGDHDDEVLFRIGPFNLKQVNA